MQLTDVQKKKHVVIDRKTSIDESVGTIIRDDILREIALFSRSNTSLRGVVRLYYYNTDMLNG